jgi:polyhydroxyalkanoate synthesis regulator protein
LERSLQTFLDQQQQFRSQLNSMLGQSPMTILQSVTERNLELLKQFQQTMLSGARKPDDKDPKRP